jgi:hypothetical protein
VNNIGYFHKFDTVNKLVSIFISSVFLLQSFGIHYDDIVQLDEFIEHAQFHSDQYGDNLIVFLSKHYGELKADHQREHQEEKKDHEQLPFNHSSSITSVTAFVINTFKTELIQLEIVDYKTSNFHYQAPSSSLHSEGILQPPRTS